MGSFYRRRFGRRLARPRARPRRRLVLCSRRCLDAKTGQANSRHYGDPCTRRILLVGGRPISTSSRPGWVLLTSEQRYLPGCEIPSRALLAWGGRMPHGEIAQRDDSDQARLSSRRICMSAMFAESSSRSIVFEAVLDLLRHDFSHLDVRSLEEVSCECFGRIAAQEAPD
jgi:hypothetical protein